MSEQTGHEWRWHNYAAGSMTLSNGVTSFTFIPQDPWDDDSDASGFHGDWFEIRDHLNALEARLEGMRATLTLIQTTAERIQYNRAEDVGTCDEDDECGCSEHEARRITHLCLAALSSPDIGSEKGHSNATNTQDPPVFPRIHPSGCLGRRVR